MFRPRPGVGSSTCAATWVGTVYRGGGAVNSIQMMTTIALTAIVARHPRMARAPERTSSGSGSFGVPSRSCIVVIPLDRTRRAVNLSRHGASPAILHTINLERVRPCLRSFFLHSFVRRPGKVRQYVTLFACSLGEIGLDSCELGALPELFRNQVTHGLLLRQRFLSRHHDSLCVVTDSIAGHFQVVRRESGSGIPPAENLSDRPVVRSLLPFLPEP